MKNEKFKVLHVNTLPGGGAGAACLRLHQALTKAGVESKVLTLLDRNKNADGVYQFFSDGFPEKYVNYAKIAADYYLSEAKVLGQKNKIEIFTSPKSAFDICEHALYKKADIIHLHWVARFMDYESFFAKNEKPVVWTFHDANPFTGGCHVATSCRKFERVCDPCPQLEGAFFARAAKKYQEIKRRALQNAKARVWIVTPSKWLGEDAGESAIMRGKERFVINNGADVEVFYPEDSAESKKSLSLPTDKSAFLFVSDAKMREYKGFPYFAKAAAALENRGDLFFFSIGAVTKSFRQNKNMINLGYISDKSVLRRVYSAADAFVTPSLSDNFPNTVVESVLCGTPVIGFPIGGIMEIVRPNKNGILAEDTTVESLKEAIEKFVAERKKYDSARIAADARKKYDSALQAERFAKLYKQILDE